MWKLSPSWGDRWLRVGRLGGLLSLGLLLAATSACAGAPTAHGPTPEPSSTASLTGISRGRPAPVAPASTRQESAPQPSLPIRAAFYYPWYPRGWLQDGTFPYTNYHPSAGYYDSADPAVIRQHIAAMLYGNIQVGIASWWGPDDYTDTVFPRLLHAAGGTGFRWAIYYELEGISNPAPDRIRSDLTYIRDHYGSDPNYLRINGRFVVFVYGDGQDDCGMADRWSQGNTVGAYVDLKVFPGYRSCDAQPDGWHQYAPAVATDYEAGYSYTISPGFWKAGEQPRLDRDPGRWRRAVRAMVASGAPWQLVTTFNEWGEGTAVEPAREWSSASGYGTYLDALHSIR